MSQVPGAKDIVDDIIDLQDRVTRLEQYFIPQTFDYEAASVMALGSIDGDEITGVRITANGYTSGTGVASYLRLLPNGISTMTSSWDRHYFYWPLGGPGVHSFSNQGDLASNGALPVWQVGFSASLSNCMFDGIFYTKSDKLGDGVNGHRHWTGTFLVQDLTTNRNNRLQGEFHSIWGDATTVVDSLSLALDQGTFTGRVSVQVVP